MRRFTLKVLDDYVVASGSANAVYTKEDFNDRLGQFDALAMFVVMDNWKSSEAGTSGANLQIQHSADGRLWVPKRESCTGAGGSSTPELNNATIDITKQWAHWAADPLTGQPPLRCVRLKFWFSTGGSAITQGHVRIYVTARDRAHLGHASRGMGTGIGGYVSAATATHGKRIKLAIG